MQANGREEKGKGQAQATVVADITSGGGGTQVKVSQDINMSGAVAQYGRGMMQDVAGAMLGQFANCLKSELSRR
jgi:carbon monoxide dehydrogenase subunit G